MITYVTTSIFESSAQVLVNAVNTQGIMGKGIAKTFKELYPAMFLEYRALCERKQLKIGQLHLYKTSQKWILNLPTKQEWRKPSKIEYIEAGLKEFLGTYTEQEITSIAFPMLGCGSGQLDWETEVKPLMEQYLTELPIDIYIHIFVS